MPKSAKVSWGIDIGNCTLKALKLGSTADGVEVLDYAVIKHEKILSQPDVDESQRQELIRKALTEFLSQHDVSGAPVIVSVPGHNSFARFIKLPPVESKRITEIVRFEAIQQIPFDINDVEWDWQAFTSPNDPEVEVGIFAIKRDLVKRSLEPFSQTRCPVHVVQMAPMALYNYLHYDYRQLQTTKAKEAIILLDIGAENTDLVIADGRRVWQRSIPIGGNQFTAAVQKAFKLGFAKAEAIKRSAGTSKYARQIFQAMRSVFADLAAEIQRSLGFYSSGNRDVQFREVLALGNAMRLPGLPKFLQQSLSLPIKRLDSFEAMKLSPEVSVAQFTENLPSLAVAYGLALQGLGKGAIDSNLLPTEIARQSQWQRKRRWFIAASALFMLSTLLFMFRSYSLKAQIESQPTQTALATISTIKREVDQRYNQKMQAESQETQAKTQIREHLEYYQAEPRRLVPLILQAIQRNLPNESNTPQQKALFEAYRKFDLETIRKTPRSQRPLVFLHQVNVIYTDDLNREFDQIIGDRTSRRQTGSISTAGAGFYGPGGGGGSETSYSRERSSDLTRNPHSYSQQHSPGAYGTSSTPPPAKTTTPGFVVVLEGTTPHQDELKFLFTPSVGTDRSRWGFFNRLRYLGKTDAQIRQEEKLLSGTAAATSTPARASASEPKEPNLPPTAAAAAAAGAALTVDDAANVLAESLPFETFFDPDAKSVESYFDYSRRGWILGNPGSTSGQPAPSLLGIAKEPEPGRSAYGSITTGRPEYNYPTPGRDRTARPTGVSRQYNENVYLDPFTQEPISVTFVRDDEGEVKLDDNRNPIVEHHDHWFQVRFKIMMKKGTRPSLPASASAPGTGRRI